MVESGISGTSAVARTIGRPVSRRGLMALAGSAAGAALLLPACGGSAKSETARFGEGDVGVLNYLLTLEHLQATFYADAVTGGFLDGSEAKTVREFGAEEARHVSRLTAAVERMGGEPQPQPQAKFPLESARAALELGARIENLAAAAYLGQVGNLESTSALATVLSIHSVEGRHAAALDTLLGRPITPDGAFAKPAPAPAVLRSIDPYLVG